MTRIATFMAEFKMFCIEISKNYSTTEWREDLKKVGGGGTAVGRGEGRRGEGDAAAGALAQALCCSLFSALPRLYLSQLWALGLNFGPRPKHL